MMLSVDWSTLAPTVLGGLLAIGGGVVGSSLTERKAVGREKRTWDREDALRTFADRRSAYLDLLSGLRRADERVTKALRSEEGLDSGAWYLHLFEPLTRVMVFGLEPSRRAAQEAHDALLWFGMAVRAARGQMGDELPSRGPLPGVEAVKREAGPYQEAFDRFVEVIRADLGVAATPVTSPVAERDQ